MYLGNDGGIYRSNDTGATWHFVGEGMAVSEYLNGTVASNGTNVAAGSWDNGASKGDSSSPIWTSLGGGDVTSVDFDRANNAGVFYVEQGVQKNIFRVQGSSTQSLSDANVLPDCTTGTEDRQQSKTRRGLHRTVVWPALAADQRRRRKQFQPRQARA
jgi:hypothetical protein